MAVFLAQVIVALFSLLAVRLYSDILSVSEFGLVMLGMGGVAFFDALYYSSINQATFYFIFKGEGVSLLKFYLSRCRRFRFFCPIFFLVVPPFDHYFLKDVILKDFYYFLYFGMFFVYLLVDYGRSVCISAINAFELRFAYAIFTAFDAGLAMVCTVSALYLKADLLYYLYGLIISRYIVSLVLSLYLDNYILKKYGSIDSYYDPAVGAEIIKYIKPFAGMGVAGWLGSFFDRYLVAYFLGVGAAGSYSVANGLVGRGFNVVGAALSSQFRPLLFKHSANGEKRLVDKILLEWILCAFGVGFFAIAGMYIFGSLVVTLLLAAEHRSQATELLPVFCIVFTITILTHSVDNKILASNRGAGLFFLQCTCIPLTLLSVAVGGYFGGILGAVWSRVFSESLKLCAAYCYSTRINSHP